MSGKDEGKTFVPAESEGTPPVAYLQTGGSELEVKGTTDKDTRSLEAKVETGEATGGEKIAAVEAGGGKGSVDQKKECVEARGEGADEEVRGGKGVSLHKGNNRGGDGHQQKRGGGGGYFLSRFFSQGPRRDRKYYESLSLDEKRQLYKCKGRFVTLGDIDTWKDIRNSVRKKDTQMSQSMHSPAPLLDSKVSLWRGDITHLEIDAIVNAANSSLLGGGGIDGAIHNAAGNSLYEECLTLNGCRTGGTKITSGHKLPAKYILHTVGPTNRSKEFLKNCYGSCFKLALENNIKSLAFCCIATGIYGYPNERAADVALSITREWLESNADQIDRIIFCVFLEKDLKIYRQKLHQYFPGEGGRRERAGSTTPPAAEQEEGGAQGNGNTETDNRSKEDIAIPSMVRSVSEPVQRLIGKDLEGEEHESMETEDTKQHDTTGTHHDTGAGDTQCVTVGDNIDDSRDTTDEREAKRLKAEAGNKMETKNGTSTTEI